MAKVMSNRVEKMNRNYHNFVNNVCTKCQIKETEMDESLNKLRVWDEKQTDKFKKEWHKWIMCYKL